MASTAVLESLFKFIAVGWQQGRPHLSPSASPSPLPLAVVFTVLQQLSLLESLAGLHDEHSHVVRYGEVSDLLSRGECVYW